MPQIKKYLTIFGVIALVLAGAFFALVQFLLKPEAIEKIFFEKLQSVTADNVSYQSYSFQLLPSLTAEFHEVALTLPSENEVSVLADTLRLRVKPLEILLGKTEPASIELVQAEIKVRFSASSPLSEIAFEKTDVSLTGIRAVSPINVRVKGYYPQGGKLIEGKGTILWPEGKLWEWNAAQFEGSFDLEALHVADAITHFRTPLGIRVKNGTMGGSVTLKKLPNIDSMKVSSVLSINELIYEADEDGSVMQSPTIGAGLNFELSWNPKTEVIKLERSILESPLGQFTANGEFFLASGEVKNVRATAMKVVMESLPQYWMGLNEIIPFNMGFSGLSNLDMSLEGTLGHLSVFANWDLSETLLTYGQLFSKPKSLEATLSFDGLVQDFKKMSGDFTAKVKSASIKGSLQGIDIETGEGQLNIISNKFDLLGWQELVPLLQGYDLGGELKVLVNVEGNLKDSKAAKHIYNLSVENAWISKGEYGIRNASFQFDAGPVTLDFKKAKFQVDDSSVTGDLKVLNRGKNAQAITNFQATNLAPEVFFETLSELGKPWIKEEWKSGWEKTASAMNYFFPEGEVVDSLKLKADYKASQWTLDDFSLKGYDGELTARASLDMSSEIATYWADLEVNRLSLARFTTRGDRIAKLMDGNLFLQAGFTGDGFNPEEWRRRLHGSGKIKVTNGEFYTFDVLGKIAQIQEFEDVGLLFSETTPFDDLQASFDLTDEKVLIHNLAIETADFNADARGEMTLEGILNSRLDVFLSPKLTKQVVEPLIGKPFEGSYEQFGPIPLLLAGPLGSPEMKADSMSFTKLLADLERRKNQRSLRNFLPEGRFFAR